MAAWMSGLVRGLADEAVDDLFFKMLKDKYTDNLLMVLSVMKRLSFFNAMELWMRAVQGEALERPLGTHLHLSPWEMLLLNPVHLHRLPVADRDQIDLKVTIGPAAQKPLTIDIPVYITGMSYGSALSKEAKIALAKAASAFGTATNTGESGLLPDERQAADKLIGQYNRGGYLNTPERYRQLDAIEIQLGQGAQAAAPQRTKAKFIDSEMRQVYDLKEGQDAVLHARLPGADSASAFVDLVGRLQQETGVPVGVKLAASHYLERELEIAAAAGVDFVTVDGAEGGTHGGSPTLEDDLGLPAIYAVARARRYLDSRGLTGRTSLLAGGGLFTPGQFLKALALGADAVYIGTAAILALVAQQMTKAMPAEPPSQLILQSGRLKDKFDVDLGVASLGNFLKVALQEMESALRALGKAAVSELAVSDLCCLDPWLARSLGVDYAGVAPAEQGGYYQDLAIFQQRGEVAAQARPAH